MNNEIIKNNQLIAEFMGGMKDYHRSDPIGERNTLFYWFKGGQGNWRLDKEIRYQYFPKDLFYHTDWDWLMPVVEKIFDIAPEDVREINQEQLAIFELNGFTTPISEAYKAVVQFIKWHNTQSHDSK